jgi:hypothetical protein
VCWGFRLPNARAACCNLGTLNSNVHGTYPPPPRTIAAAHQVFSHLSRLFLIPVSSLFQILSFRKAFHHKRGQIPLKIISPLSRLHSTSTLIRSLVCISLTVFLPENCIKNVLYDSQMPSCSSLPHPSVCVPSQLARLSPLAQLLNFTLFIYLSSPSHALAN